VQSSNGMGRLRITHFTDPGCPWAWSASPHLAVLRWRYGDQLEWRHVMIGLTEERAQYESRGYTGARMAAGYRAFRSRGMPFATAPRERVHGTGPMCRVVVAARLHAPEHEWAVLRALQFAQFTSTLDLEDPDAQREALAWLPGVDGDALVAAAAEEATEAAYQADRREARTAAGGPTQFQGKAATTAEGEVRYTAPSLILTAADGRALEAGGFQSTEAYDVCIANLDTSLARRAPATSEQVDELLAAFPEGLTTAEVAAVMAPSNTPPDLDAAEDALIAAASAGAAERVAFGHDALWRAPLPPARALSAAA
jgi:protein-disulfide isomerase-like protein with CxxC motif